MAAEESEPAADTSAPRKFGRDLTRGSIPRHLISFSLPMLAGNLIQTAYSIINAMWVGKGLGKRELAAVTVSFPAVFVLVAVAGGLTMATGILVAQYAGARDWKRLRDVVQTSTLLMAGAGALLVPLGQWLTPTILTQMRTAPDVYPLAEGYMRIFLFTIPLNFGIFLVMSMLRGVGDSKTPLYFQGTALLLTAVLDPILMFGWLGFPRMGINGAALASVLTQAGAVLAVFTYLHRKDHVVAPDWRRLRVDWPTAWLTLKLGLPSAAQQSLVSLGFMVVVRFVNSFGENATAAFGAAMRIDQVAFMPAMTIGMAVSTLVGQNIGAGQLERVREVFRWGVVLGGGITLLVSLVAVSVPRLIVGLFVNDPAVIEIGVHYLRIMGWCYVFLAMLNVGTGVLNGAGHTFVTTLIALVALWMVRVPLAAYLSQRLGRVEGVWYAMAISSAVAMSLSLGCYFAGLWRRPVVRHVSGGPGGGS